jgi:hypothetical protein
MLVWLVVNVWYISVTDNTSDVSDVCVKGENDRAKDGKDESQSRFDTFDLM